MRVSYEKGLANYFGLQRRGGTGDRSVLSVRAKGNGPCRRGSDPFSDRLIVPAKLANCGGTEPATEPNEGRDSATRNDVQADLLRTPGRVERKSSGLHGVREAARKTSRTWRPTSQTFTSGTSAFAPDSRQEPYEVILHVRNCAGGGWQQPSLPR